MPEAVSTVTATALPTPTLTRGPTIAPTPTPTTTLTPTPTATATQGMTVATPAPYREFKNQMIRALEKHSDVPIRFRGMRIVDTEIYFVVNYTAKSESWIRHQRQRDAIIVSYSWALWWHDEEDLSNKIPTAIRILDTNNTGVPPKATYVSTSDVQDWNQDSITSSQLYRLVALGTRNQTSQERKLVKTIDRAGKNRTFHNETLDSCC
jgi:hypothetical protein